MTEPRFVPSTDIEGWPEPVCNEFTGLTNTDLADYIAACGHDFDGVTAHVREALVRLLRRC
jgi:hypothetical protein